MIFRNQLPIIAQNQPKQNLKELAFWDSFCFSPSRLSPVLREQPSEKEHCPV